MVSIEEQIKEIDEEIRNTKYNKATQHHVGKLKAKLARLKGEAEKRSGPGKSSGFSVKKSGHATVSLVGFPSAGKSTLLNQLTDANSEVGDYAFTTLTVVPGVLHHKGANIQLLDLPGLIKGASKGRGMGRAVIAAGRSSDLIILLLDVFTTNLDVLVNELKGSGIRINQKPADIALSIKDRGGLVVNTTMDLTILDEDIIVDMIRTFGHNSGEVVIREDINEDQLVDFLTGNRVYPSGFVVLNKIDLVEQERIDEIVEQLRPWPVHLVSAKLGNGTEELKDLIYDTLGFIRIYMKPQGEAADMEEPLVLVEGSNIGDVCDNLHRDFRRKFRYAQVTGRSAKFPDQTVGIDHGLEDEDIVTVIIHRT